MPRSIKCSICGARSKVLSFDKRMAWLRRHRKKKHPKAHRESVQKMLKTKGGGKVGKKSRKKTYKKKSTAKKAKRKGESLYKVKGGWRISRKK